MTDVWIEPCGGSFAVGYGLLSMIAGRSLPPPLKIQGGKQNYVRAILEQAGNRASPSRFVYNEPGPYGRLWHTLHTDRFALIERLSRFVNEDPTDLWQRLAAAPVPSDPLERVAVWTVLQFWSWGGKLIYPMEPDARQGMLFGSAHAVWRTFGFNRSDAYNAEYREARGEGIGRRNIRLPDLIARLKAVPELTLLEVHQRSALELDLDRFKGQRVTVLLDPPYQGTLGYGPDVLERPDVIALCRRYHLLGFRVILCEAEPLDVMLGHGWTSVRIDDQIRGRGRTWAGTQEWLTLNTTLGTHSVVTRVSPINGGSINE